MACHSVPDVYVRFLEDGKYLIYSPLAGKCSITNSQVLAIYKYNLNNDFRDINQGERQLLIDCGLVSEIKIKPEPNSLSVFHPTSAVLLLTTDCNLRCLYCYGSSGSTESLTMDFKLATETVDFIIENAQKQKVGQIELQLHGIGEPTLHWGLLKDIVTYANNTCRAKNIKPTTGLVTNGILSDRKIDWIINNITHASLSFDGPKDIQNRNRPLVNNRGSFDFVLNTAKRFVASGYDFGVRATITDESVKRLEEIFDFFVSLGIHKISLEPMFVCGRCHISGLRSPSSEDFAKYYTPLIERADKLEVTLENSFSSLNRISQSYCGATGKNFCVTPQGYVSSCYEAVLDSDPLSEVFFYGSFNRDSGYFEIDEEKRKILGSRQVYNLSGCQDCFAKWNCGGECLSKRVREGDLFNLQNGFTERCKLHKILAQEKLLYLMKGAEQCN